MTPSHPTPVRGFRLVVEPATTDTYALRLEETNGNPNKPARLVAHLPAAHVPGLADILHQALRESHQARTTLTPGRRKPIPLEEPAGVRLALALLAAEPITKPSRRHAILSGIANMSTEETYYWYSKTTGEHANRARRALRILLADDGRTGLTS